MSIESIVYNRLNDGSVTSYTSDRIYPTDPNQETDFPFLVYTTSAEPSDICLGKATGNQQYTVTVDIWCKSVADRRGLEQAVKGRLHVYSGSGIQLMRLASESSEQIGTQEEGDIYHGMQGYTAYTTIV